ncbi:hypothetical protein GCM10008957_30290 [Deinococcus ruber]|uniref:Uncharacterized protein n=1 Tax=Deinococcus ruber TaxID=1848197 RepID=A0A918F770_9DEIO|nr:hypothetical protein GCM10008957_30290 [Deinococcus ruber]
MVSSARESSQASGFTRTSAFPSTATSTADATPAATPEPILASTAGGTTTSGFTNASTPYTPGTVVPLHLDTAIGVYAGVTHPVWAKGDDGSVWRGEAALDDKSGRITLKFTTLLLSGKQYAINAYAESADGQGIGDHTQTVTKDMARSVINSLLNAATGLVQSQATKTTTISQGFYSESTKPQNFWLALGGGLANAFVVPDVKATSVQLGQMKVGETVQVRVDLQANADLEGGS